MIASRTNASATDLCDHLCRFESVTATENPAEIIVSRAIPTKEKMPAGVDQGRLSVLIAPQTSMTRQTGAAHSNTTVLFRLREDILGLTSFLEVADQTA